MKLDRCPKTRAPRVTESSNLGDYADRCLERPAYATARALDE